MRCLAHARLVECLDDLRDDAQQQRRRPRRATRRAPTRRAKQALRLRRHMLRLLGGLLGAGGLLGGGDALPSVVEDERARGRAGVAQRAQPLHHARGSHLRVEGVPRAPAEVVDRRRQCLGAQRRKRAELGRHLRKATSQQRKRLVARRHVERAHRRRAHRRVAALRVEPQLVRPAAATAVVSVERRADPLVDERQQQRIRAVGCELQQHKLRVERHVARARAKRGAHPVARDASGREQPRAPQLPEGHQPLGQCRVVLRADVEEEATGGRGVVGAALHAGRHAVQDGLAGGGQPQGVCFKLQRTGDRRRAALQPQRAPQGAVRAGQHQGRG